MAPIVKSFFEYCYLGQGHASLKFSDRNFKKNFGKKFPPRGSDPTNFLEKWIYPPYGNVPANFHPDISKTAACRRVLKFKNVILAPLRLRPRAQGGPGPKIFFAYFFMGQGHDSLTFSNRYLEKKFGKNSPPQGGPTPKIFGKVDVSPKGNVPAKFHPDISKTVACRRLRKTGGQKNRQGRRCPAKTGSPIALIHIPLDRAGGT